MGDSRTPAAVRKQTRVCIAFVDHRRVCRWSTSLSVTARQSFEPNLAQRLFAVEFRRQKYSGYTQYESAQPPAPAFTQLRCMRYDLPSASVMFATPPLAENVVPHVQAHLSAFS